MGSESDQRQVLRLLRLVSRSGGKGQQMAAGQFSITVAGQRHGFDAALVRGAIRKGLLGASGGALVLRQEGQSFLRRMLHPEASHAAQHVDPGARQVTPVEAPALVNLNESPLARLYQRRDKDGKAWLGEAEFAAGERLRADFERAGLQPRISANWEASVASGSRGGAEAADISDFAMDARKRVDAAIATLEPALAGVTLDICCFLKGLEQVERERSWPPRSAKLMLRTALSLLARHYGLCGGGQSKARMQHWGAPDYRPSAT
jgi:hypothetical protein